MSMRRLLRLSTPGNSGSVVTPLSVGDMRYLAVRAGANFEDWVCWMTKPAAAACVLHGSATASMSVRCCSERQRLLSFS
jgi:hypothetical protein